ncbi:MAG: hypothetical protein HOV81_40920 [Kofleriaceae bacterium]|nr:hypothetical protein [Kofleriaceae bacterium]
MPSLRWLAIVLLASACAKPELQTLTSGPIRTNPVALHRDFIEGEGDLLAKYRNGVTLTGSIRSVGEGDRDEPIVMMDVDGRNMLSLEFADPAAARHIAAGDRITVTCRIAGASGALMMVTSCVL